MASIVTKREFRSQIVNGENWTDNPLDFTFNLVGTIGARIQATHEVDISWESTANAFNAFDIDGTVVTQSTGSFVNDGFYIGDVVDFIQFPAVGAPVTIFSGYTITNVTDLEMRFDGDPPLAPQNYTGAAMYGKTPQTGFQWNFGLIPNDATASYNSLLDGALQQWYADGVGTGPFGGRDTTPVAMQWNGLEESNLTGSCKVNFVGEFGDFLEIQRFRVVHDFIIPFYQDGDVIDPNQLTPPALFAGASTLKYTLKADSMRALSNPNTIKSAVDSENLGSVGWFNERYNGQNNNYFRTTLTYTDTVTAQAISGINAKSTTAVSFRIVNGDSPFSATTKAVLCVGKLPDPDEYQNLTTTFEENFVFDSKLVSQGQPPVSSTIINNLELLQISPLEIQVDCEITYSAAQQALLGDDKEFALWLIIQNDALDNESADRVPLLIDSDNFLFDNDIPDLFFPNEPDFKIIPHDQTEANPGYTDYKGWVEDGLLLKCPFFLNTDLTAILEELNVTVSAFNSSTQESFDIQTIPINLSSGVTVSGVQQFAIDETRGYKLADGDIFNKLFLENTGATTYNNGMTVFNVEGYDLTVGIKLNFEDHIPLPEADTIFFDSNEPLDNLNKKTSNYSGLNGYQIQFHVNAVVSDGSVLTNYRIQSGNCDIRDYDQPVGDWTCEIETFDQSSNNLDGGLSDTENTLVKATYTLASGSLPPNLWGIIRAYPTSGTIADITELSSLNAPPPNNLLVPVPGESLAKVSTSGNQVFVEAETDVNQLDPDTQYCESTRLGASLTAVNFTITGTPSFTGGSGGTWETTLEIKEDGLPVSPGITFTIAVSDSGGPAGLITYLTGDEIGVDAPQQALGIGPDLIPHMTGTLIDGGNLTLNKKDYAIDTCRIDDALNDTAEPLTFNLSVTDGFNMSNLYSPVFAVVQEQSEFNSPFSIHYLEDEIFVFVDRDNNKIRLIDHVTGKTKTIDSQASPYDVAIDTSDISNGLPVIYMQPWSSTAAALSLYEYRYDGKDFIKTNIHNYTIPAGRQILVDPVNKKNGKSFIWVGTWRGTGIGRDDERLILLSWNGASYDETDFKPLVTNIVNAEGLGGNSNMEIRDMKFVNGDIYLAWQFGNLIDNGIIRLQFTGADYEDPNDWTHTVMSGLAPGNADGNGAAIMTWVIFGLDIVGFDGFLGKSTGVEPMLGIVDGLGQGSFNIANYRQFTYNAGLDNFDSVKLIAGTTIGDQDGIGPAAEWRAVRHIASRPGLTTAVIVDSNNDCVYKLDLSTNSSTKIAGFNAGGDQDAIGY